MKFLYGIIIFCGIVNIVAWVTGVNKWSPYPPKNWVEVADGQQVGDPIRVFVLKEKEQELIRDWLAKKGTSSAYALRVRFGFVAQKGLADKVVGVRLFLNHPGANKSTDINDRRYIGSYAFGHDDIIKCIAPLEGEMYSLVRGDGPLDPQLPFCFTLVPILEDCEWCGRPLRVLKGNISLEVYRP